MAIFLLGMFYSRFLGPILFSGDDRRESRKSLIFEFRWATRKPKAFETVPR